MWENRFTVGARLTLNRHMSTNTSPNDFILFSRDASRSPLSNALPFISSELPRPFLFSKASKKLNFAEMSSASVANYAQLLPAYHTSSSQKNFLVGRGISSQV